MKFILSVCVILIHIPASIEPEFYSAFIKPLLTRFAVPCFFIISGWFMNGRNIRVGCVNQFKRLLPLTIISTVIFYAIFGCQELDKWDIINLLLYNSTDKFGYHIWYLYAYLYILAIFYLLEDSKVKYLFVLIPILLGIEICLGKYSILIMGKTYPHIYCRNFLVTGLLYFLIGYALKYYENRIPRYLQRHNILLIMISIFSLTTLVEKLILMYFQVEAPRECYLSTPFLAIAIFMYFKQLQLRNNIFSQIGRKYSLYIYVTHPALINAFLV